MIRSDPGGPVTFWSKVKKGPLEEALNIFRRSTIGLLPLLPGTTAKRGLGQMPSRIVHEKRPVIFEIALLEIIIVEELDESPCDRRPPRV